MGPASNELVTAADLERLPEEERYELIEGRLVPMWPLDWERGLRTATLSCLVALFVKENKLGRCVAAGTGFLTAQNPETVLAVSFAFTRRERAAPRPEWSWGKVIPDLVLSTRAPSITDQEARERSELWLHAGVRVSWDLAPTHRTLTIYQAGQAPQTLTESDTLTCEELLPGFALPMYEVFDD